MIYEDLPVQIFTALNTEREPMFGYVLPEKPELKIREYELFRAYYCGVCKSIGKRLGQVSRLTLNYDSTFLALLLSSISGEKPEVRRERCIAHPLKKKNVAKNSSIIDYASDINIILAYYNLKDDWSDDHSLVSGAASLVLKPGFKKIFKRYNQKCVIIESRLKELAQLEKQNCGFMDQAAEPFAKLMEEVMDYGGFFAENVRSALRWIGYNLGRWIYILDAYDDLEKDIKRKSYNPLIVQFEYKGEEIKEFKERIRGRVEFSLTYSLSEIAKAFELVEVKSNSEILENIIYMGMLRKTENILGIGGCGKIEKSV